MVPEAEQPGRLSCKRGSACWTSSPRWSGEPKNDMQGPWAHWPKPPKIQLIWSYFVVAYRVVSYSGYVLGTGRESCPLILTYKLLVEVPSLAMYRMILGTLWDIYNYIYIFVARFGLIPAAWYVESWNRQTDTIWESHANQRYEMRFFPKLNDIPNFAVKFGTFFFNHQIHRVFRKVSDKNMSLLGGHTANSSRSHPQFLRQWLVMR